MTAQAAGTVRERLVKAGIQELRLHGIRDFSVRRVASECGVSCAAPYKHFEDKNSFIAAIIEYMVGLWESCIPGIIARHPGDMPAQLTEISVRYVQFLVENSYFRSIITVKDSGFDQQYADLRHRLSNTSRALALEYREAVNMPHDIFAYKLYIIRSLIHGASLMFDNGEMEYNDENLEFVRRAIRREFDLP